MDLVGLGTQISGWLFSDHAAFYLIGSAILVFAILAITEQNLVRSCTYLLGCFGSIALLFFQLQAQFVAISQLLVYGVGITLLILFATMLIKGASETVQEDSPLTKKVDPKLQCLRHWFTALLCGSIYFLMSLALITATSRQKLLQYVEYKYEGDLAGYELSRIGKLMMSEQLLSFELISLLLLVAFVSVIILAKRRPLTQHQ